ncbi:DUF3078 domain-containing protein [Sphingobacteriaceae bacterium WQ 2009]|uniref:DUF3078 domain-containing protein n=1 Tax=Rhinopithecimicrobium faecis TaxID=2820698 RepID=A0A8T4HHT1_9SPHI|nr:DUF3078 domain-containing protein [Sphingobacteriaceae bacterium WQ 2009]
MKLTPLRNSFFVGLTAFGCSISSLCAQENLRELRIKPDSIIHITDQRKLNIKPIVADIPDLALEVDYWKHWTKFGINLNQSEFNDYWNAGGVSSISIGLLANHKSDFTKDNFNFVTEFDLRYGKLRNKGQIAKKNQDRIFWDNKLSYKLSKDWSLFTSITFESQFDAGYSYTSDNKSVDKLISSFMAPAYITESFGLEYKPDKSFSLRFGTGTARQTIILDKRLVGLTVAEYALKYPDRAPISVDQKPFGVDTGKKFKNDLAFQLTANLDKNITSTINVKSRYNLFANFRKFGDPSHRLDLTVSAKVSRLVNVTLNGVMIYDSDVISKVQLSESLAMGLVFSLPK